MIPPSIQKFDLEDTGKLVAIVDVSEMMREYAVLIRGGLTNALAFISSSYLFTKLSKDSINKERKRHDLVTEQLQKVQVEWAQKWQERIDFISKEVEANFEELNDAIRVYHEVFGHELWPLPQKPVLSNFYPLSNEPHSRELVFIALSILGIGRVL